MSASAFWCKTSHPLEAKISNFCILQLLGEVREYLVHVNKFIPTLHIVESANKNLSLEFRYCYIFFSYIGLLFFSIYSWVISNQRQFKADHYKLLIKTSPLYLMFSYSLTIVMLSKFFVNHVVLAWVLKLYMEVSRFLHSCTCNILIL